MDNGKRISRLRPCVVKDGANVTKALFHQWMESDVSGEKTLYAVVELPNGKVKLTYSRNIQFMDCEFEKAWENI